MESQLTHEILKYEVKLAYGASHFSIIVQGTFRHLTTITNVFMKEHIAKFTSFHYETVIPNYIHISNALIPRNL